ncbi:MAG: hypothetical protein ACRDQ4_04225 [Pseudonocardiaceae bacterium]
MEVAQVPGAPADGELGAWDALQVLAASSGVLAVAVQPGPDAGAAGQPAVRRLA